MQEPQQRPQVPCKESWWPGLRRAFTLIGIVGTVLCYFAAFGLTGSQQTPVEMLDPSFTTNVLVAAVQNLVSTERCLVFSFGFLLIVLFLNVGAWFK